IKRPEVPIITAVLILEDIFGVIVLTYFGALQGSGISEFVLAIGKLALSLALLVLLYIVATKFSERLIGWAKGQSTEDITPFLSILFCGGFAYIAYLLGLSPSAGAFIAGSVIATFKESHHFVHSIRPHSLLFTSFFFICIGTMVDLHVVLENMTYILAFIPVIIIGLLIAMGAVTFLFADTTLEGSLFTSIVMLPPGVFSLLVARESAKFAVDANLIAIVSTLLLVLSIIMSVSLPLITRQENNLRALARTPFMRQFSSLGTYIRRIFAELSVESTFTAIFQKNMARALLFLSLTFTSVVLAIYLILMRTFPSISAAIALILAGSAAAYKGALRLRSAKRTLLRIMSAHEGIGFSKRTNTTLNALITGTALVTLGVYTPLILFPLGLSVLLIAAMLILTGAGFLRRAITLIGRPAPRTLPQSAAFPRRTQDPFSA
ncbi:MAG: cation:proton antiporter, partial [Nitrosarchaeum sp.]|nr:cation:proton antiporter [Nitrosarchaeum sp.]